MINDINIIFYIINYCVTYVFIVTRLHAHVIRICGLTLTFRRTNIIRNIGMPIIDEVEYWAVASNIIPNFFLKNRVD